VKENYPKLESENHVIVRIKACGLNFAELMQRQGFYSPKQKMPYTPGFEGSGIIEQVGSQVNEFSIGDRVIVYNSHNIWKEVVCVSSFNCIKMPDSMSFDEAAGFMVNYMTAYQCLVHFGGLRNGHKVLIHMAAGGVGIAATQICKTFENVIVFGTASSGKHEKIKQNGCDYPIDYTAHDFYDEIKKLSPEGVDIVLDPLNGEASIKGYSLLKPFGKIIIFGAASLATESGSYVSILKTWWKRLTMNSIDIITHNKSISGYHLGYLLGNSLVSEQMKDDINALLRMYNDGKIKIQIDSVFKFSDIGKAMNRMHSRLNIGKIILKPNCELKDSQ
jgi:synaptic vesicle membrane protein VAT-1